MGLNNPVPGAGELPIGKLIGANLNSTADQAIPINAAKYNVRRIVVTNVSADISAGLAAGGVYTAAAKGGTAIVAAVQVYAALTGATIVLDLTLAVSGVARVLANLFLSLTVANGSAATADVYVFGDVL